MIDTSRISTIGLFRFAFSYLEAAEYLLTSNKEVLYPRLFLYSHSIELGLKAFIFEKTNSIKKTHNLVKLQKEAENLGYTFSDTFKSILKTLTYLNEDDYRTRYFKRGPTSFPNNEILKNETNLFFNQLSKNISDEDTKEWIRRFA